MNSPASLTAFSFQFFRYVLVGAAAFVDFFLLMMFPHSLVFGQGLGYRSLMFAPFFCLAAVRLSTTRWCVPAIALLAAADVVVLLDPLSARG